MCAWVKLISSLIGCFGQSIHFGAYLEQMSKFQLVNSDSIASVI
jgi:hypothetical protein